MTCEQTVETVSEHCRPLPYHPAQALKLDVNEIGRVGLKTVFSENSR
jgi:hypothetical protein